MPPVDEPVVPGLDRLEELVHEPALTDPWNADEGYQLRLALAHHAGERLAQECHLLLAADEGSAADSLDRDARTRLLRLPDGDRLRLALGFDRPRVAVLDRTLGGAERRLVDEDAVRRRSGLQACGRVDDVTRRHAFARLGSSTERDERLARGDADTHLEVTLLGERIPDRERSANRSLGIVLVCDGRAEDGHHRVANELLDRPTEALELRAQARVVGLQQPPYVLGVHALGAAREADEVAEEAGDNLALLALRRRGE